MNSRSSTAYALVLALMIVVCLVACGTSSPPEPEAATATTAPQAPEATAPAPTDTSTPRPSDTPAPPPPSPTPTDTPTPVVVAPGPTTPVPETSRCAGLAGSIEVQILVGPAEVAGLEPVAVGSVPFAVASDQAPYAVQGSTPIAYADVLVQEWGTYAVTMDVQATISGECSGVSGAETLDLTVEIAGEQLVEVDAGSFHGEYPWNGSASVPAIFPLQEGATAEGEGWSLVLHLQSP
ncbi:MAG: hypothetical protein PVG54_18245 [Anaerolineae bacterium]|jgi:hypothetical protein